MRHLGQNVGVPKTVDAAHATPEVGLWAEALVTLAAHPKLDNWVRVVLFNWILNRVHLRHPGVVPWNSENWHVETDPAKLRERKAVSTELILECACVAKVKNIDWFMAGLTLELDREWRHHWSSETTSSERDHNSLQQLKKIALLSSELSDVLGRLLGHAKVELSLALDEKTSGQNDETSPPPQTEALTKHADADPNPTPELDLDVMEVLMQHIDCVKVPFVEELDDTIEIYASAIRLFASAAVAAAAHAERMVEDERRRRSRGRPGTGGGWATAGAGHFKTFTLRILLDVRAAGGHLTLNKNNDETSGTLVQLLKRLRPYVPSGLIPAKTLPLSTLNRVKVLDQKIAAAAKSTAII
jgi:hypothetical protein